ncbi:hypothetical protein C0J52_04464 [Blattella germanica]|nr:hypothetical protein C0J52_04464 [Blattella germanica]
MNAMLKYLNFCLNFFPDCGILKLFLLFSFLISLFVYLSFVLSFTFILEKFVWSWTRTPSSFIFIPVLESFSPDIFISVIIMQVWIVLKYIRKHDKPMKLENNRKI